MKVEVGSFSDPEGLEGLAHFLGEFTTSLLSSVLPPSPLAHLALLVANALVSPSIRCVLVLIESAVGFVLIRGVRIWSRALANDWVGIASCTWPQRGTFALRFARSLACGPGVDPLL